MDTNLKVSDTVQSSLDKGSHFKFTAKVNMHLVLRDEFGNIKDERELHNTVTDAGLAGIIDQVLDSPSLNKIGWMAIGEGTPTALLLGAEIARVAFTSKTRSLATVTVIAVFGAGVGTGAITEAGTFDVVTANSGNMWMKNSFAVINKTAGDSLTLTWGLSLELVP